MNKKKFLEICVVEDYHDFDLIANSFPNFSLKAKELGLTEMMGRSRYVGVIYNGSNPSEDEIKDALSQVNISIQK